MINEILSQGENSSVEFKVGSIRPESLAKEIVAFANTHGGTILFGVDDSGSVVGIDPSLVAEEWCMNVARTNLQPALSVVYREVKFQNKTLVLLEVPKGKDKPYQTMDGKFYIRVGSTNRLATLPELMRLFQSGGMFHFDGVGLEKTSAQDLNYPKLAKYFESYRLDFAKLSEEEKNSILKNTDVLTAEGKVTVAGALLFGVQPQKTLPEAIVRFACFKGTDLGSELIHKKNIDGDLESQVNMTVSTIQNLLLEPSRIEGVKRVNTTSSYPQQVFRELIVNAVCHRNYSISGSAIRVFLFSDRLEITSPGRLPNTVTIDKLTAGVSYASNPILVKFMENLGYIDKLGRGLPMVSQEAKYLNKYLLFEEIGEDFQVKLEM